VGQARRDGSASEECKHVCVFNTNGRRHVGRARPGRPLPAPEWPFDVERDLYVCPEGEELKRYRRTCSTPRDGVRKDGTIGYRASKFDCETCLLKSKCCPNAVARRIARSIYEAARDKARAIAKTAAYVVSRRERKKVEMLFTHLKRILRLDRLRLRGPNGAKDEFLVAATAQNLRKLAKLVPLPAPTVAA
jgi:Transposase DDE domain